MAGFGISAQPERCCMASPLPAGRGVLALTDFAVLASALE
jgi:hypothetical protein